MLNQVNSHNEYALIKNNKAKLENRPLEYNDINGI